MTSKLAAAVNVATIVSGIITVVGFASKFLEPKPDLRGSVSVVSADVSPVYVNAVEKAVGAIRGATKQIDKDSPPVADSSAITDLLREKKIPADLMEVVRSIAQSVERQAVFARIELIDKRIDAAVGGLIETDVLRAKLNGGRVLVAEIENKGDADAENVRLQVPGGEWAKVQIGDTETLAPLKKSEVEIGKVASKKTVNVTVWGARGSLREVLLRKDNGLGELRCPEYPQDRSGLSQLLKDLWPMFASFVVILIILNFRLLKLHLSTAEARLVKTTDELKRKSDEYVGLSKQFSDFRISKLGWVPRPSAVPLPTKKKQRGGPKVKPSAEQPPSAPTARAEPTGPDI